MRKVSRRGKGRETGADPRLHSVASRRAGGGGRSTGSSRRYIMWTMSAPLPPLDPRSLAGRLRARALAFPEATEDFPWGERAIKVRGKAFLFLSAQGNTVSFSVKLPHSDAEALELPGVAPTRYGLGKHGWITATVDGAREAPVATYESWLEESYRAVAPKRLVAQLDAPAGDASRPERRDT